MNTKQKQHMIIRVSPIDKSIFRPVTARGLVHFLAKNPNSATIALDDADILREDGLNVLSVIKSALSNEEIYIASVLEPVTLTWIGTLNILTTLDLPDALLDRAINRTQHHGYRTRT